MANDPQDPRDLTVYVEPSQKDRPWLLVLVTVVVIGVLTAMGVSAYSNYRTARFFAVVARAHQDEANNQVFTHRWQEGPYTIDVATPSAIAPTPQDAWDEHADLVDWVHAQAKRRYSK